MINFMRILLLAVIALQTSCALVGNESREYMKFAEKKNYVKSYAIYTDVNLLGKSNKKNTVAKVNLKQQRIRLVVNGKTALDSPATTGKKDFGTPTGHFRIIDKLKKKESNLYGTFYKDGKRVFTGSEKEYAEKHPNEKLEYDDYKGAALDNWLRLTRDGVGIHKSKGIFRRPASHGCVRVPLKTSNILFAKLSPGSVVEVVQSTELAKIAKHKNKVSSKKKATKNRRINKKKPAYMNKHLSAKERLRLLRKHNKS